MRYDLKFVEMSQQKLGSVDLYQKHFIFQRVI